MKYAKRCAFLIIMMLYALSRAQSAESIQTLDEANAYNKKHPDRPAILYYEIVSKDSIESIKKKHHNVIFYNDKHRVVGVTPVVQSRVSEILLDGSKMSEEEIDKKRNLILQLFHSGKPFKDLIQQYSMEGSSANGDVGWFEDHELMPEFAKAVNEHVKGEVFTVYMPERKWHFIVLKTENKQTRYKVWIAQIPQ